MMDYQDDEIERLFEKLPEVPVPEGLSQRIAKRIDSTVRRRKGKVMRRSLGTAAAGILLFSGSVMFVPSFAVYAKQIPGLEAAIKWLEGAGEYIGIRNAKEHGYLSTPSYKTTWGNREVSVDNLFLEDDRLHVDITIKGEDIAEAQRNGRMANELEDYVATLPELETHQTHDGTSSTTRYPIDTNDEIQKRNEQRVDGVVRWTYDLLLNREYAEELKQSHNRKPLKIRLTKVRRNEEFKVIDSETDYIEVPFGAENVKPTRVITLNRDWEPFDSAMQQFVLQNIQISPTRMIFEIGTRIEGGGKISLHPRNDWDKTIRESLILSDETGKVYPIRQSGSFREVMNGLSRSSLEFVPSVYFNEKPTKMTLEIKKIWMTQMKVEDTFHIRLDERFPKKVSYRGKDITIQSAEYDNKKVMHLKVQADETGHNPWDTAFLTYEPYYLKLQETDSSETWKQYGLDIHTPETKAIPLTGEQLYEQYQVVGGLTWSPEFGMIVDNYVRWNANEKKPVYDIAIIAPKLKEYEISIRRFMDPVTINQKIEFTIPPTGAGDGQEGTLLEPKYAKTVADLDVSVVEQARREMREAAGHDIELYGVEEYKGAAYHNVTVYSKDHKSRVALDLNKGTANVHVSMSYRELPSDLKHIIETATRMNGSQLAAEVKKLTRTKSANERIIRTSLEGDMTMTLENNRIESMFITVPMDQVDAKALAVAEQAVRDLKGKHVPFVKASHHLYSRHGQPINIYVFEDQKDDLRIEVGFQTGRLISVYTSEDLEAGTDATEDIFRKFTDEQVLEAAAPYVQKLFGIDLNGYKVEREKGTSYYTFTKEDGPAIKASMNRHFKFYDLEILTENGAIE
ncbi:DUF4179 domain-containing protein [Paenibacillus apiarius]|uniref:DUF4179 domain-containing protein n=1 Tax=Paenibacillus apiarius TaxID=46240 RepID=A0ABT4DYV6_9BACL|nr:DUF4179 domain-containing protein [Paenibacillus apiarius]MCY9514973.1 DUF4179 domain-containing protein [Paenibacillus apiarius]MCY9522410.1 DUF4179 domain-containing protein [Paenibacillus apiarius]MCY9552170.1 DUF4179 domain-containing protein [Paenibacillus apiarius]MCY9561043.1 DUF4179 domain-containing protein [Paenibacillus apiarius]MCY9686316.1 DUF4179 domain-containing protein [Paenibacillus apiarius]